MSSFRILQDWQGIWDAQGGIRLLVAMCIALTYTTEEDGTDDEYGKPRRKPKSQSKPPPHTEVGRATKHTLDENLEQMMSGSFDMSFLSGRDGEGQHISPHMDARFDFGDSEDDFGFGDIGDELAKELGEGWASAPVQPKLVLSSQCRGNVYTIMQTFCRGRTTISHRL